MVVALTVVGTSSAVLLLLVCVRETRVAVGSIIGRERGDSSGTATCGDGDGCCVVFVFLFLLS